MRSAVYRDYNEGQPEEGRFSISTSNAGRASVRLNFEDARNEVKFAADDAGKRAARDLGTSLLRWSGSPLSCTLEPYRVNGLSVEVLDGEVTVAAGEGADYVEFIMSDENVIDFAQRLIVWAGVE